MIIFLIKLLISGAASVIALSIIYWVTDIERRLRSDRNDTPQI